MSSNAAKISNLTLPHLFIIIDIRIGVVMVWYPRKFNAVKSFIVFIVCALYVPGRTRGVYCGIWGVPMPRCGGRVAAARLQHGAHRAARCTLPATRCVAQTCAKVLRRWAVRRLPRWRVAALSDGIEILFLLIGIIMSNQL